MVVTQFVNEVRGLDGKVFQLGNP